MPSSPSIDERLAHLEAADREIGDLRHVVATRLEDVRRGSAVFDSTTREHVRRLRQLESEAEAERAELERLVALAFDAVLARRREQGVPPRRPLWLESAEVPDLGMPTGPAGRAPAH